MTRVVLASAIAAATLCAACASQSTSTKDEAKSAAASMVNRREIWLRGAA